MQKYSIIFPAQREFYEKKEREFINDLKDLIVLYAIFLNGGAHGYQIMKFASKYFGYNPGASRIYPELKNQERKGHVICKTREVKGRLRKVYTLTPKGNLFLKNSLVSLENIVQKFKNHPILKWYRRALNHRN